MIDDQIEKFRNQREEIERLIQQCFDYVAIKNAAVAMELRHKAVDMLAELEKIADKEQLDSVRRLNSEIEMIDESIEEVKGNKLRSTMHFDDESKLMKLGYQITDMTDEERWEVLSERAVPVLGLRETAAIIRALALNKIRQRNGEEKFSYCLRCYQHDLERLRKEFYENGNYGWNWNYLK